MVVCHCSRPIDKLLYVCVHVLYIVLYIYYVHNAFWANCFFTLIKIAMCLGEMGKIWFLGRIIQ